MRTYPSRSGGAGNRYVGSTNSRGSTRSRRWEAGQVASGVVTTAGYDRCGEVAKQKAVAGLVVPFGVS